MSNAITEAFARHERIAFQFSGGKDSTALLMSMRKQWDRMTVYNLDTGDVHPETLEIVSLVASMVPHFVSVKSNVFAVKQAFGIPTDLLPWTSAAAAHACNTGFTPLMQDRVSCCFRTTMMPMHLRMIEDGITLIVRGQKDADELKGALRSGDVVDGVEYLYPFSDKTDDECFDIMRDNGIEPPRFYAEGLVHSGDCMGCTAWNVEETRAEYLKKYHPEKFEVYRRDMLTIADAVEGLVGGVYRAAAACLRMEN